MYFNLGLVSSRVLHFVVVLEVLAFVPAVFRRPEDLIDALHLLLFFLALKEWLLEQKLAEDASFYSK